MRENRYFQLGVMLVTVLAIGSILLGVVLNLGAVGRILATIGDVFSPLVLGLVFAYLLNPLMNFAEFRVRPFLEKRMPEKKAFKLGRAISLIFALLCAGILVYEFFAMLVPQLYDSVVGIVNNFSGYYASVEGWVSRFLADNPAVQDYAIDLMGDLYGMLKNWATNGLLPSIETIVTGLTSSVMSVVTTLMNILIGLCAAVYMLCSRDTFMAQSKKIVVALFQESTANHIFDLFRRIHKVFSGFIVGKILDSLIIGILCYIGMLILKLPYPALIATVVGVTNVIPFFGPIIGAIPCFFLILLVNPLQAVYFGLFVLALQQLDGNVIGPRILGDSIGISGFWVLVSITVAGGLFGFAGMLLGVPVFAVLYMIFSDILQVLLKRKGHPVETEEYHSIQKVKDLESTDE